MNEYQKLLSLLQGNDNFIITCHVNPDGDAIGSVLAMHRFLVRLGKKARVIIYSPLPHFLMFLDRDNVIEKYDQAKHDEDIINAGVFIAMDFNRADRIAKMAPLFGVMKGVKICIDHHQDPQDCFDHYFTNTDWCATGHFMYKFISETNLFPLTLEFAEPLYAAIMTDTGSFRFERTTPEVHYIAARLLEAGVVPNAVHASLYDSNHPGKLMLMGDALKSIQFFGPQDGVGVMMLTQEQMIAAGTREDDTEGFIAMLMSIEPVKIGLKFLELKDGFKVSVRSKGTLPSHLLAAKFGGGGHRNAAGIRFKGAAIEEHFDSIIETALTILQEKNAHE